MLELHNAGFPKPWSQVLNECKTQLVSLLANSAERATQRDKTLYPPVIIEQGAAEFVHDGCWRVGQLEPFELSLFREHSGRKCFFGFIRIDRAYNETEAVEAFRQEFRKRWPKTKGGGSTNWSERLKQLVVMRIWKQEPDRWRRLKLVAELCGYKGCVEELAAYNERCKEGYGDEPMNAVAKVEMSRARAKGRKFFQSLFPGEEPLSYHLSENEKS